jgi:hypothetical protein
MRARQEEEWKTTNAPAYANKEKTSNSSVAHKRRAFCAVSLWNLAFFPRGVVLAPLLDTFKVHKFLNEAEISHHFFLNSFLLSLFLKVIILIQAASYELEKIRLDYFLNTCQIQYYLA